MKLFIAVIGWCLLFILCWPLALLVLVAFPLIWLVALPFRLAWVVFEGFFALLRAIFFLPARLLGHRG